MQVADISRRLSKRVLRYSALVLGLVSFEEVLLDSARASARVAHCDECPEMMTISGGEFVLGSPHDEVGHIKDEGPQRDIRVSRFELSRFEITVAEFRNFVSETGFKDDFGCFVMEPGRNWEYDPDASWEDPGFEQEDNHPVVCITWLAANAYIDWLNTQSGGGGFRLPTEAEWEYAARAGSTTPYWWGTNENDFCKYTNGVDRAARERFPNWERSGDCDDGFVFTAPVGHYDNANGFGVEDMVGNVWEWVADCYVDNYAEHPDDGSAVASAQCDKRVFRGGAWGDYGSFYLRTAYRGAWDGAQTFGNIGFRVARTPKDPNTSDVEQEE